MKRWDAIELLAAAKGSGVSVATMRAIPDWYTAGGGPDRHLDNIGCMGGAAPLALGIALAQPGRRVMVVDGDGSLLMQLGVLASVAGAAPANFYHFVLVNRIYETSGHQAIPAADRVDFAALALGAGYPAAFNFDDPAVLRERLPGILDHPGPVLVALEVDPEDERLPTPSTRPHDPAGYLRAQLVG
jgi:thiamine pyrophosphate-dependent acetolactate synthase large subunit-like protein